MLFVGKYVRSSIANAGAVPIIRTEKIEMRISLFN